MAKVTSRTGRTLLALSLVWVSCCPANAVPQERASPDASRSQANTARCTASHVTPAPDAVTLSIDTTAGTDSYRLIIAGREIERFSNRPGMALTLSVGVPETRFRALSTIVSLPGSTERAVIIQSLQPAATNALQAADTVSLTIGRTTVGPLRIDGFGKGLGALQGCTARQLTAWGADSRQFLPGGKRPAASVHRDDWVPNSSLMKIDFASSSYRGIFRVDIDTEGRIGTCSAIDAGGSKNAEAVACAAVVGKPLFDPARAPGGTPVTGVATFVVELFRR